VMGEQRPNNRKNNAHNSQNNNSCIPHLLLLDYPF